MASASNLHLQSVRPQVVPHEAPQSMPYKVPPLVTQDELALFLSLRGRLHQLELQVESAEQSIKQRLEQGALVEEGDHSATLEEHFRRNVSWKEVVIRLSERLRMDGAMYCARVLAATKPTRSISVSIS